MRASPLPACGFERGRLHVITIEPCLCCWDGARRRKEFRRATEKRPHKATLCACIYFDVKFWRGSSYNKYSRWFIIVIPAALRKLARMAMHTGKIIIWRNWFHARFHWAGRREPLLNKASFFIQIHNIYMWGNSVALLSCSRLFYFPRSEKWACAPQLLFTAPAPLAGDLHSIFFKALVIKNNAKAPSLALASGKKLFENRVHLKCAALLKTTGEWKRL